MSNYKIMLFASRQRILRCALHRVHQGTERLNASMTVSSKISKMEIVLMDVVVAQNDKMPVTFLVNWQLESLSMLC
ncbi:unnamed protein product [Eruca vesicaria subsp. sativa]|uniref:Uncharacterized protein n=1 Tax=Eruca vesicaria subsp. sativa TaxID=29727 RepID=A0ABC8JLR4_ERUVS|nr:unnamed protein product [Eruca vesicaria subsp. sativa]